MLCLVLLLAIVGCQESSGPAVPMKMLQSVPYLDADQVEQRLIGSSRPIFVEFCVPLGCDRCDKMREQVDRLAAEFSADVDFCRVNFNTGQDFAAKCGVKICPSYVLLESDQTSLLGGYPTSDDLLRGVLQTLKN